ncbi:MAG: Ig-like domain-containing protein [Syntrophomonadaceae bacterium]
MNSVSASGQSTSVVDGSVTVSSGGQSVSIQAGQGTQQTSAGQPPAPPQPMTPEQQQAFLQEQSWIVERVTTIQQAAPVVTAPPTVQQQQQQAPAQAVVPSPPQQAVPAPAQPAPAQTPPTNPNMPSMVGQIISNISQVLGADISANPSPPLPTPPPVKDSGGGSSDTTAPTILISSIAVMGADNADTVLKGETLQMHAAINPANATNRTITWSVTNGTGSVIIESETGLLTGTEDGTVTVKATAHDGSGVVGEKLITVVEADLISTIGVINSKVSLTFRKTISEAHIDTTSNWVPVVTFTDNTSYKLSILDANGEYSMCLHRARERLIERSATFSRTSKRNYF